MRGRKEGDTDTGQKEGHAAAAAVGAPRPRPLTLTLSLSLASLRRAHCLAEWMSWRSLMPVDAGRLLCCDTFGEFDDAKNEIPKNGRNGRQLN